MDAKENKKCSEPLILFPKKIEMKKIQLSIYYENPKTFGQSYVYQPTVFENDQNAQKNYLYHLFHYYICFFFYLSK